MPKYYYVLCSLLISSTLAAQQVEPVISNDYLDLLKKDSANKKSFIQKDTAFSMKNARLHTGDYLYNGIQIQTVRVKGNQLQINRQINNRLLLGGIYSIGGELKTINRQPALQTQYVQGRSQNGSLVWNGPETNELFSYGPALSSLEFDGSNYPYDINGRLVNKGSGNGLPANLYKNNIFRTASSLSQSLNIQAQLMQSYQTLLTANIKLSKTNDNLFIQNNKNSATNFATTITAYIKNLKITGGYSNIKNSLSNDNRNGFLNRIYQSSLLTPISFDNSQGGVLQAGQQRSYSAFADNPSFLSSPNDNYFHKTQQSGSLLLSYNLHRLSISLTQSLNIEDESSNDSYKAGTAYFPNDTAAHRYKNDKSYTLTAQATYNLFRPHNSSFSADLTANYNYQNNRSAIDYPNTNQSYTYQRSTNDLHVSLINNYQLSRYNNHLAKLIFSNKIYTSNTANKNLFFLPGVSGVLQFSNLFKAPVQLTITPGFNSFASELPISQSLSQANLLQLNTVQALQYFPVTELKSFAHVDPIRHNEWTGRVNIDYKGYFLYGEFFSRNTLKDVFPIYVNGQLILQNIADHRNTGFDISLGRNSYNLSHKATLSNSISFFSYTDKITSIADGYNYTPIAGFSNVNKALVLNHPVGSLVGNSYAKDASGRTIIGGDGFPLINNQPSVIGNPTPDFVLKMKHALTWKKVTVNIDWEWKKGGDIWNGTQAVLDYYGRSANTAAQRNITNYVFDGVLQSGHVNNIPVDFYSPSLPLQANKWVRYGYTGVATDYIQKADHIRINTLSLAYKLTFRKYIQQATLTAYIHNLIIWSAYKGVDPNQLLFDQFNTTGLDFFNLPSTKTFGLNLSIQF